MKEVKEVFYVEGVDYWPVGPFPTREAAAAGAGDGGKVVSYSFTHVQIKSLLYQRANLAKAKLERPEKIEGFARKIARIACCGELHERGKLNAVELCDILLKEWGFAIPTVE